MAMMNLLEYVMHCAAAAGPSFLFIRKCHVRQNQHDFNSCKRVAQKTEVIAFHL